MFADHEAFEKYHGYNPAFLRAVRERRRLQGKSPEVIAQEKAVKADRVAEAKAARATRRAAAAKAARARARAKAGKAPKAPRPPCPADIEVKEARAALADRVFEINRVTASLVFDPADALLTAAQIIQAVGDEFGVTVEAIKSERRTNLLVAVRRRAIVRVFLAKPKASLPMIGKWFDRDHTTIMWSLQRVGVTFGTASPIAA